MSHVEKSIKSVLVIGISGFTNLQKANKVVGGTMRWTVYFRSEGDNAKIVTIQSFVIHFIETCKVPFKGLSLLRYTNGPYAVHCWYAKPSIQHFIGNLWWHYKWDANSCFLCKDSNSTLTLTSLGIFSLWKVHPIISSVKSETNSFTLQPSSSSNRHYRLYITASEWNMKGHDVNIWAPESEAFHAFRAHCFNLKPTASCPSSHLFHQCCFQ